MSGVERLTPANVDRIIRWENYNIRDIGALIY